MEDNQNTVPTPTNPTPEPVQEVAPVAPTEVVHEDLPTAPVVEATPATETPATATADEHDIQQNTMFAILAYISFLCFIPLFTKKDSAFARFHAKQGFVLFFISLVFVVMMTVLKTISPWTLWRVWNLISNIGWIAILVMSAIGVMHVLQKHSKELPFIGHLADPLTEKFKL
ncbi:MAG: hypothetical protein PHU71_03130 [Candidatus Gracilibacteria bacterium]|nr:hypothetical protein [Candidatus Gracilibacteria bacterium]